MNDMDNAVPNKDKKSKKNIIIAAILLLLIGGVVWIVSALPKADTPAPAPTPSATTSSPVPTATPIPTPTPTIKKDFNITVDGVAYTSKEALKGAIASGSWVEPVVVCDDYGVVNGVQVNPDYVVDYYTNKAKIAKKYTDGSNTTMTPEMLCSNIISDPEVIRSEMRTTGGSSTTGVTNMFPFEEFVVFHNEYRKTQGTDKWFFYVAMEDYNSWYFMAQDMPAELAATDTCFNVEEAVNYRKDAAQQHAFPGGCSSMTSASPMEYEIINTPQREKEYRAGYAYAKKITSASK